jgi:hypothetical protein
MWIPRYHGTARESSAPLFGAVSEADQERDERQGEGAAYSEPCNTAFIYDEAVAAGCWRGGSGMQHINIAI